MRKSAKCYTLFVDNLHAAAAFAVAGDPYLGADALVEFFAMGDDAYAAVALSGDVLQLVEGGHDAVEAFLVEGAKAFVNEEDVDIKVGAVEGGEGKRQGERHHKAFASREDGDATHLVFVVSVKNKNGEFVVVFAAGQRVAVSDLL